MSPNGIFHEASPEDWQPRVPLDEHGNVSLSLACLLVRVGDRRILVDTGFGPLAQQSRSGAPDGVARGARRVAG